MTLDRHSIYAYNRSMGQSKEEQAIVAVVDYILNKADAKQLEVISAAVERKEEELSRGIGGGAMQGLSSINPENMAKQMSSSINKSVNMSLDGIRETIRNFATDIIRQQVPEIPEEQLDVLLDSWIPEGEGKKVKSLAKHGKVSGLPSDVLYGMILQFVSYSIGEMSDAEQKGLRATMGEWTEKYWQHFPNKIRQEIKRFIGGEISSGEFRRSINALLF